jgi:hypothetical protein
MMPTKPSAFVDEAGHKAVYLLRFNHRLSAGTGHRRLSFFIGDISGATMDREKMSPPSRPASKANAAPKQQVNFEKAQGSSCHDEADLRDVARKAAKRSQERK